MGILCDRNAFSYNNYIDGTGMIIEIREASSLVGKEWMCDDWVIILPTPVSSINSKMIQNDTIIQLGLVCYLTNPRFYSDNFDLLITSGAVEAHIKDINQNIIEISNTTKPITIKGRGSNQINEMTLIKSSEFENYQILDIHAFRTLNWNISIQLIIVESDENLDSNLTDLWMFSAHQRLPGPFQNNHQWKFELSTLNETRTYFIDSSDLINSSSLFYVGIGQRIDSTNESFEVDYGIFENKQWSFKKSLKFDYLFSAITKGCYSYSLEMDQFNSKGMSPNRLEGMSFVNCSSNHMTLYSVGSFNPITNADFNYIYVTENIVKNVRAMLSAVFLLILYAGLMLTEMLSKRKDISEGRIRFLSDNQPFDGYMYIITVETGYKMFATTDSTICFNLTGTEGDQIFRSFKSEEDHCYEYPFQWGQSSRFLMTTAFPLGNLEYMRIWIDDAGLDHRESWYCNRIIVKDLQTQQIFYFPFFNWLGTKNGDGETERLARVEPKRRFVDESMSLHILSETISWIAAFTGGGNRNRMRVSRYEYSTSIISIMTLLSVINAIICYYDDNSSTIATTIAITQISFGFKDIIIGILMALALTIFSMIHILICYNCRSSFEEQYLERYKLQNRTFKDPTKSWPYPVILISRSLFLTLILLGSLVTITIGMSLTSTAVDAFFFRFLLMFLLWIFIFEPIKGFIMAFIILKRYPNHKISSKLEEELLHVKPVETFTRNPYGRVEMNLGTEIADVTKLKVTEDRKMRDEQLFITVKDILCLFVSLFIMISLTYYCKDRHGYWYQKQISTTFQLSQSSYGDQAFMSITKADDFWNWARNSLAKTLRASWYDGNAAFGMRAFLNDKVSRSMGIGKIRQIRIKKSKECKVLEQFQNYIGNCEEELGEGNEETTEFMEKGWNKFENDSLMEPNEYYSYKKADELMTTKISGSLNSYGGGGYTVSLAGTVNELINTFSTLEDEQWIDQYTRAIIIEFSQYNAQINYFSVVQLLIEIPKSGIYLPNVWVESVRLIKSEGADGQTVQFFEIVYIIFSVIIFIKEISIYFYERYQVYKNMETIKNPIKFVANLLFRKFSPWNLMDLMVGGLALSSVVVYLLRQIYTKQAIDEFNKNNGNTYINLSLQRNTELAFLYCLAGTVFLTSCKVIRILKFNRRIGILAATLDNALVSICGFGFVFVVFCLTFDSVLYVILGNKLFGYRSLISALQTSLAGMLGKLDITIISPVSQFGSIVAVIFIMLGSKLLLQLYVTIIMFEFENIRNDSERQTNEYEIIDHIKYKTKHRLGLLQPKDSHPVSIPDTQKDFRLFQIAQAKANFLHYRVNQILQGKYQFKYSNRWKFNMIFDPTDAIGKGKNSGKRTNKWRLNDLKLK